MQMHVTHKDIASFADNVVNLPSDHARKYREQVKMLSDRLDAHIRDNPDYHLKRVMLSGSLAKHTSLRSISDADMALYVQSDNAPEDMAEFIQWLVEEMRQLYSNKDPSDIQPQTYSVSISFRGTGLDVDVVPICWLNDDWDGNLVSQDDGGHLKTNIPQHLEFMMQRHKSYPNDFRQVVRLLKYWAGRRKQEDENFRFKSFMIELIMAHLADKGQLPTDDYPEAMRVFFDYINISNLDEVISFNDFECGRVQKQGTPINIFDPVNSDNNVAGQYTQQNKDLILDAALDAADAIVYAACATTKEEAQRQWRRVFGSSFRV